VPVAAIQLQPGGVHALFAFCILNLALLQFASRSTRETACVVPSTSVIARE
jgi:hypothetical protein